MPSRSAARVLSQARRALHERAGDRASPSRASRACASTTSPLSDARCFGSGVARRRRRNGAACPWRRAADQDARSLVAASAAPSAALVAALRGGDERRDRGLERVRQRPPGPTAPSGTADQSRRATGPPKTPSRTASPRDPNIIADVGERGVAQLRAVDGRSRRSRDAARHFEPGERAFAVSRVPRRASSA